jgi:hemerythrin-like domain-containing protein
LKATEQLKKEHKAVKVILRVLDKICKKLEAGEKIDVNHMENILDFFKVFVDQCHHAKEENLLFVAIRKTMDPSDGDRIGALLKDHVSGRNYIRDLSKAVANYQAGDLKASVAILHHARNYMTLLLQHIDIEDNVLYPIANEHLSIEKQEELYQQFDKLEETEIGAGKHEEFHKMIDRLKGIYLN